MKPNSTDGVVCICLLTVLISLAFGKTEAQEAGPQAENAAPALFTLRNESKLAMLVEHGGNENTEAAVMGGLQWIAGQQRADGSWSLFDDEAGRDNRVAATGLALLALQGAGNTHRAGTFQQEVDLGWKWLLTQQNAQGEFSWPPARLAHHRMYAHALGALAVADVYAMTLDPIFRQPSQLAVDYAEFAQAPMLGGWRYTPKTDSDTSVTGWFVSGIYVASLASLSVPDSVTSNARNYLDTVELLGGAAFPYQKGRTPTVTMSAVGLLCRQYLGRKAGSEPVDVTLTSNEMQFDKQEPNSYYWYYAAQFLRNQGGPAWQRWNKKMGVDLPSIQVSRGPQAGSWSPEQDEWGVGGGRLFTTCLCVLTLETYYRYPAVSLD